jgi:DNA polymerase-3 subunit gamma/tau
MSHQVLARKWRPRSFETLVGQEHVVRALTHALEQNRLHHAYLFTGTRGVGKTTLARILAKSLNCETGITSRPCGKCSACLEVDAGRFVDLLEVDAATNTKVDEMRQLLENAVYAPTRGRFKVYVIDEVHMLSTQAFNAMLKTLEEPPEHIKFILATTDPQKIPVTVLSRCLQFNLKQMPAPAISGHLKRVLEAEEVPAEEGALRLIAQSARGSMRDALSLTDQAIAYSAGDVTEAQVRAMLGAIDDSFLYTVLEALTQGDGKAMLAVADEMLARNLSFDGALQELATLLHRIALVQMAPAALSDEANDKERLLQLAQAIFPEDVQLYYQIAIHGREDLPLAPDEYAGFTMALLRMLAFRPGGESDQRLAEAARGERVTAPAARAAVAQAPRPGPSAPGSRGSVPAVPLRSAAPAQTTRSAAPLPPPERGQQPSAPPAPSEGGSPASFSGDWPALVRSLRLGGLAAQLAQASELRQFADDALELCLPPANKHLAEKTYQERLRAALETHFGRPIRLSVQIGEIGGNTARDRAVAAISQDAFVQDLVKNCDGEIVESSIKPAR